MPKPIHARDEGRTRCRHACALLLAAALAAGAATLAWAQDEEDPEQARRGREVSLVEAAKDGDLAKVRTLLDAGTDPNAPVATCCISTRGGPALPQWTPFEWAASRGDVAVMDLLLASGADPGLKGIGEVVEDWFEPLGPRDWSALNWMETLRHPRAQTGKIYVGGALEAAALAGKLDAARFLVTRAGASPGDRERSLNGDDNGWTALMYAAMGGDPAVVSYLLEAGASPNEREPGRGYTALHFAARRGKAEAIRALLDHGADPGTKDDAGRTPLHLAAGAGSLAACRVLLSAGAGPEVRDGGGWTALHWAAANGKAEIVSALLDAGASAGAKDDLGRTPLHLASASGNSEACLSLLVRGADPQARDAAGLTALHFAAASGDVNALLLLCQAGVRVNARDALGYTPLHYAAWLDRERVAALLILRGAKVDAAGEGGMTPLHLAVLEDSTWTVPLLLLLRADPNSTDDDGWTPLHLAAGLPSQEPSLLAPSPEVVELLGARGQDLLRQAEEGRTREAKRPLGRLLEYGADVSARNAAGETPLHVAAAASGSGGYTGEGAAYQVQALLDAGADVNAVDRKGQTPLNLAEDAGNSQAAHMLSLAGGEEGTTIPPEKLSERLLEAMNRNDLDAVKQLLDEGADPNARDPGFETPLLRAAMLGEEEIALLLLQRGADAKTGWSNGTTALHLAASSEAPGLVEELIRAGAEVDAKDDKGYTPLHSLCRQASSGEEPLACLRLLLGAGADVNATDDLGETPLHLAAFEGDVDLAKALLAAGAKLEAKDRAGMTPMAAAVMSDEEGMADFLRSLGAAEAGEKEDELLLDAETNDVDEARSLLEQGAHVNFRGWRGETAAILAAQEEDLDMLELLAEYGADFSGEDQGGRTALNAVGSYRLDLVAWLLDHGAAPKRKDGAQPSLADVPLTLTKETARLFLDHGYTVDPPPGEASALIKNSTVAAQVELLLGLGANPNARGPEGQTALHVTANGYGSEFSQRSVDLLIAAGADVNAQDDAGRTPAHEAVRRGRPTMLQALALAGADFTLADREGLTPLDYAKRDHDVNTVAWLQRCVFLQKLGVVGKR